MLESEAALARQCMCSAMCQLWRRPVECLCAVLFSVCVMPHLGDAFGRAHKMQCRVLRRLELGSRVNPKSFACFADESFVGHIAKSTRHNAPHQVARAVLYRYLLKLGFIARKQQVSNNSNTVLFVHVHILICFVVVCIMLKRADVLVETWDRCIGAHCSFPVVMCARMSWMAVFK